MNTFDWPRLRELITEGARRAFLEVLNKHADKDIFGYCLYSDDSAMTICHIVGFREDNRNSQEDDEYWNPHEWQLQDGLHHLDEACTLLNKYREATPEDKFEDFRDRLFETGVAALETLRSEGFFPSEEAYVLFSVFEWDEESLLKWVEQLNPEPIVSGYKKWMAAVLELPLPTRPDQKEDPNTGVLSDIEKQFLCLASRGRLDRLVELHGSGIRDFVVDEALVLAASKGKTDVCEFLLSAGARPNHRGYNSKTALEFAEQEGRTKVVALLSGASQQESHAPKNRYEMDREIFYLLSVVIPQQRAARE